MIVMATTPPDRSTDQRRSALEKANEIRFRRAQLKRDLKAGRVHAAGLIKDPPEWLETMKLVELIMAMPKIGRVKANRVFKASAISHSKTVGGLSPRQRDEVVRWLR